MVSNYTYLPTYEELTVPQEIPLSTPSFKAAGPYMHMFCESKCKEFMLCRKEEMDPRKCLKEGATLTECGIQFLRKLKKTCRAEFEPFADCIDHSDRRLYAHRCMGERRKLDKCIYEHFNFTLPELGYFAKPHVHHSTRPKPVVDMRNPRDYKAEAKAIMDEYPEDRPLPENYRERGTPAYTTTFGI